MTTQLWLIISIVYLISCGLTEKLELAFLYFEVYTLLGFVPLCLAIATYIHAVYVLCGGGYQGTTVLLTSNVIMVICSGIVIPITYLPDFFAGLSKFLPAYHWNQLSQKIVFSEINGMDVIIWIAGIIFWLGIGVIGTWRNTQYGLDSY